MRNKIKVAYVLNSLHKMGGSERNLLYLLNGLDENVDCVVFSICSNGITERFVETGAEVFQLGLDKISICSFCKAVFKIIEKIKFFNIDLIYSYGFLPSLVGGFAAKISGIPFVSARREMADWRTFKHLCAYDFINSLSDIITVNSPAVGELTSRERFTNNKIRLIRNGVNIDKIECTCVAKSIPERKNGSVVGMVANYRPVKNHLMLLDAIPNILKFFPNTSFWLIGEGEERRKIESKIGELGISENVLLLGQQKDISCFLSKMDFFVLTSLAEGSPNAILEAMSHSLPIVATNVGGIPDAVIDGETGFLVSVNDSRMLARKINDLISDQKLATKLGKAGQERVKQFFSTENLYKKQLALYRELLNLD